MNQLKLFIDLTRLKKPIGYMLLFWPCAWGLTLAYDFSNNINNYFFYLLLFFSSIYFNLYSNFSYSFFVVSFEMIIGVGLALLLDRNIRGMSVLRTMFILPMMIAPVVVGLMWRYMYHPTVGTFNRLLDDWGLPKIDWLGQHALNSIIIADIWQWTPFIFILSLAALQSLPSSALEAAKIDGATSWQQIIHIKIPLMMPVLIVTCLLRLIDAFKVLEVILVMTQGGPGLSTEILALRISRTATEFRELGVAAAMSNYLLLLLLGLTVGMFLFTRLQEVRAARIRAAIDEDL